MTTSFFDYRCDQCEALVCERMLLFALAHDVEDTLCLHCLIAREGIESTLFIHQTKSYIQSRSCFKKPWDAFDASACPLLEKKACLCQDEAILIP